MAESRLLAAQQHAAQQLAGDDEALRRVLEESARQAETEPILREVRLIREDLRTNLDMMQEHRARLEAVREELQSALLNSNSNRTRRQLQEVMADLEGVRASANPVQKAVQDLEGFEDFVHIDRPTKDEAEALRDSLLLELQARMEAAGLLGLLPCAMLQPTQLQFEQQQELAFEVARKEQQGAFEHPQQGGGDGQWGIAAGRPESPDVLGAALHFDRGILLGQELKSPRSPPTIARAPMPPYHAAEAQQRRALAGPAQAAAAAGAAEGGGGKGAGSMRRGPSEMTEMEAALQDIRRTREELETRLRGRQGSVSLLGSQAGRQAGAHTREGSGLSILDSGTAETPSSARSIRSSGRPLIVDIYREERDKMLQSTAEDVEFATEAAQQLPRLPRMAQQDRVATKAAHLANEMRSVQLETPAQLATLVRDVRAQLADIPQDVLQQVQWPAERYAAMCEAVAVGGRLQELEARQLQHQHGQGPWDQECAQLYTLLEGVRAEMAVLEQQRPQLMARCVRHGLPFDSGQWGRVRRAGLPLGAAYINLVLREVTGSSAGGPASARATDRQSLQTLTDALRVAYRCHEFAGAWDEPARQQYRRLREATLLYTQRSVH